MEYGTYDRAFREYCYSDRRKEGSCIMYRMENETGMGELSCYNVLPGIEIIHNCLEMSTCFQKVSAAQGFLQINHCMEGCFELELSSGKVGFLGEGDIAANDPGKQQITNSRLPLGRYRGITVLFELEPAQTALEKLFPNSGINLYLIRKKLCSGKELFLMRARPEIEHIFSELYYVDIRIRETYSILKTVELLLFLSLVEVESTEALPSFSRQVVEATKAVCTFLMNDPSNKITICEVAGRFNVAETSLRQCFKSVYGQPIGAFIRSERIRRAAKLLMEHEDLTVGQIALMVGYENQSKFASAFKAVMGQPPLSYRHRNTRPNDKSEPKLDGLEWQTP